MRKMTESERNWAIFAMVKAMRDDLATLNERIEVLENYILEERSKEEVE